MSIRKKTNIKSHLVNLEDYQIIKEINRGGFGIIYLIEEKKSGRQLAAKVNFRPDKSTSIETKFLSREISILMRVEAPTITRFCGFSTEDFRGDPNVTILMDYYEHGSLRQLIEQEQKGQSPHEYDNTTKQIILCGIAHGMMTLHSRRVLHRDLKPDNVLLDINFRPYITDFGLSKFLDPSNSKSQSQSGCGTVSYMSPEVINDTHYSTKSDVYSFGILMFEVLTGEFAFSELYKKKNFNSFQIQSRVANGERPTFNVPIKPSFKKLIERCWSQDPKERPTFRELFHKLSLSLEEDDETIESTLEDMISSENETDEIEYLLDDVDTEQLFDYVYEITNEGRKKEEELQQLIEEQTKRFNSIIEQHQQEINQLKADNQREINQLKAENQREIESLKSKLNEIIARLDQPFSSTEVKSTSHSSKHRSKSKSSNHIKEPTNEQMREQSSLPEVKSSNPDVKSPSAHQGQTESGNPLEGLTIQQMREKIQKEKLTQITIPSSVRSIVNKAFYECSSLTQITIPSSVKSIGFNAFSKCSSLKQITIPSSVTSIDGLAFSSCRSLTQITIPSSVTSIGNMAFSECTSLTQITIPSSVTSIGHDAFYKCSSLTRITIPSSVTSIETSTFSECTSLTQITIPSSVTSIGNHAFFKCSSLTQITIPSSVTSIGDGAFSNCSKLDSATKRQLEARFGSKIFQ